MLGAGERCYRARSVVQDCSNYAWVGGGGAVVSLDTGVAFAATYFIMLLSLFFPGGGRYCSIDYWLAYRFRTADKGWSDY
mgnify:CR=1 FL=1